MRQPYRTERPSPEALALAEKITALILDSGATLQDIIDAWGETPGMLKERAKFLKIQS